MPSLSAPVNSKESGDTSSAKPSIIAQNSDFELGRMRNLSTMVRLDLSQKGRRQHDTPTADAVGIKGKSSGVSHWLTPVVGGFCYRVPPFLNRSSRFSFGCKCV